MIAKFWIGFKWLMIRITCVSCEQYNEPSPSIQSEKFVDKFQSLAFRG
jgi:hypothetical protein